MIDVTTPPDLPLDAVSTAIAQHLGLHFPPDRWADLARSLHTAARDLGYADGAAYSRALLEAPWTAGRLAVLAPYLTVGETYFFREPQAFAALETAVLPDLIRARRNTTRHLRIWSAGCCTGEEAYTLAIWLRRLLPDWRDWHLTILATDLNPHFLRHAAAGIYGEWSFRATPPWVREGLFHSAGPGFYAVDPSVKQMVRFAPLNLASPAYPAPENHTAEVDFIFCRNVLMYFTPAQGQQVIRRFQQALVEGGVLVVSSTELSPTLFRTFQPLTFPLITLYRKAAPAAAPAPLPAVGAPPPAGPGRLPAPRRGGAPGVQPAALYTGAVAFYAQHDLGRAEENLRALISAQIADAPALALLARVCADQGRLATAQSWIDQAIAADELHAGYHHLRATILQEQGAHAAALVGFRRALYLDPQAVMTHFALGLLLLHEGRDGEAQRHFAQVRRLLGQYQASDMVPESAGLTAGQLATLLAALPAASTGKE